MEKYGGARGATNDVTIWRIRVACWINEATCMHTLTRPGTRTHAREHTQICNIYCFSTATMICERALVLRYTYIVCLVTFLGSA